MSNFVGYVEGYEPSRNDKEWDLCKSLLDRGFLAKYNDWIKKNRSRVYDVFEAITESGPTTVADKMLKDLYNETGLDYIDIDNFFCYTLADKLLEKRGRQNKKIYEDFKL